MKILALLLCLLVGSTTSVSTADCDSIKEGKFILNDEFGGYTKIVRTATSQREYFSHTNTEYEYSILWEDPCTYKLFDDKVLSGESLYPRNPNDTLSVAIYNITDTYYEAKVSSNFAEQVLDVKIEIEQ
ncbi:hypothetical protein [Constantimarinum furrinae]|uniref:Uncharacterized protein n=1 Tax=Constantimarinum furrinae TaxID=2562285 RepID=A0A7G8PSN0_9FLAO|nr:hypothetical protein [Constantimarinum furrinae]QNJ97346.1 hypothetical protein ALE3EI_0770 [Constantimarinum furrinae]